MDFIFILYCLPFSLSVKLHEKSWKKVMSHNQPCDLICNTRLLLITELMFLRPLYCIMNFILHMCRYAIIETNRSQIIHCNAVVNKRLWKQLKRLLGTWKAKTDQFKQTRIFSYWCVVQIKVVKHDAGTKWYITQNCISECLSQIYAVSNVYEICMNILICIV